jgi:hypothetical protein
LGHVINERKKILHGIQRGVPFNVILQFSFPAEMRKGREKVMRFCIKKYNTATFEVFVAMKIPVMVVWVVTPFNHAVTYKRF